MNEYGFEQDHNEIYFDLENILMDMVGGIRKYWKIMLITCVVAVTVGFSMPKATYQPLYRADAIFTVSLRYEEYGNRYMLYTYNTSTENKLKYVLSGVVQSNVYLDKVCAGLNQSRIDGMVTLTDVSETNQFRMTVSGSSSPDEAVRVLEEALECLPEVAGYVTGKVKLNIVQEPTGSRLPYNAQNTRKGIVYGAAVSVLICVTIVGSYVLRRLLCVHKEEDLKELLGIRSYGKINKNSEDDVRSIALRLDKDLREQKKKVVLVEGLVSEEENASISIILAKMLAKNKKNVLLVDCNLVAPRQRERLGISDAKMYFSDILTGKSTWESCVRRLEEARIDFVGNAVPIHDFSKQISMGRFKAFMEEAKAVYDYVILIAPGKKNVSGVTITAEVADGIIYLIDRSVISEKKIKRQLTELTGYAASLMGGVFCSD